MTSDMIITMAMMLMVLTMMMATAAATIKSVNKKSKK